MLIGIEKLREKNNRRLPWIAAVKFCVSDYLIIWNKSVSKGTPVILQGILLTTKMLNHKFLKNISTNSGKLLRSLKYYFCNDKE